MTGLSVEHKWRVKQLAWLSHKDQFRDEIVIIEERLVHGGLPYYRVSYIEGIQAGGKHIQGLVSEAQLRTYYG